MNPTLKAYIQLCRPANLPTAAADILAGWAIMNGSEVVTAVESKELMDIIHAFINPELQDILALVFASVLLYAGGVVLNDFFDAELDAKERPERPIPSGVVSRSSVLRFGLLLLILGIGIAGLYSMTSGLIAFLLSGMIVLYNWKAKHHSLAGPLAMGSCRALNLLLGMCLFISAEPKWVFLIIPLCYIGAITAMSQGEVHGGRKQTQAVAAFLYLVVGLLILVLAAQAGGQWWWTMGVLTLFYILVGRPLYKAWKQPSATNIRLAVKWGVISLIVLDAAIASAYVSPIYTLIILALFPLSRTLSKVFAVT